MNKPALVAVPSPPKLSVEYRAVTALVPYASNARTHSAEQVAQIAASIKEFGFTNPILVDSASGIIAGHGRLLAALQLGMVDVPVIELPDLTEAQKRAYVLADNKLALNAGWDMTMLASELLALDGFDLALLGFGEDELAGLLFDGDEAQGNGISGAGVLAARFLIPPFSVLNAREGWWQDRKRAWLALGIKSELGRGDANGLAAPSGSLRPRDRAEYATGRYVGKAKGALGAIAPNGGLNGLTWGNSDAMRHPSLNMYRERHRAGVPAQPAITAKAKRGATGQGGLLNEP